MSDTFRSNIARLVQPLRNGLSARRTMTRLHGLDDRTLDDIGLPRHAIDSVAKTPSRRWDFIEAATQLTPHGPRLVADRSAAADKAVVLQDSAATKRRAAV